MALRSAIHATIEKRELPPLPAYRRYTGETVVDLTTPWATTTNLSHVRFRRRLEEFSAFLGGFFTWLGTGVSRLVQSVVAIVTQLVIWGMVLALAGWFFTPRPVIETGPRLADAGQSVVDFHRALDGQAYRAAYSFLSPVWQQNLSYAKFRQGFGYGHLGKMFVTNVSLLSTDRAYVEVAAILKHGSKRSDVAGYYIVTFNGNRWMLDSGFLDQRPVLTGRANPAG